METFPSGGIFLELQDIHDTGYFSSQGSIEDQWHQVGPMLYVFIIPYPQLATADSKGDWI